MKKIFSIEEANELVPKVKPLLFKLSALQKEIKLIRSIKIKTKNKKDYKKLNLSIKKEYHELSYNFYKNFIELEYHGCLVKDPHFRAVDFLSELDGNDILLCYHRNEDEIKFWHFPEEGFSGRKHISLLQEESKESEQ